jgi:3-deoxy-manno-octulosonate cytidylyltransferase (CMP-KDO synthetase)
MNPLILIPARLKATRLPDKPLADIHGEPMIVHCWRRAVESGAGEVAVATDHADIKAAVERAGGRAVMTREDHPSGSDRIFEALQALDAAGKYDVVINLQGDVPTIPPYLISEVLRPLQEPSVDIATLAAPIDTDEDANNPAVVKIVPGSGFRAPGHAATGNFRALYFSRARVPAGDGPLYHHIGIYAYRRHALEKFVALPPSPLELREKLEQLRALEAGMRVDVAVVSDAPVGVDTPEQLELARRIIQARTMEKSGEKPALNS